MLDDDDIKTNPQMSGDGGADGPAEPGPEGPADGGAGTGLVAGTGAGVGAAGTADDAEAVVSLVQSTTEMS